ncbi:TonB-dependent receptor plug domain-containing protein [Paracoccus sp. Ld10]|uniref:TonB-dependent receptor plug domain-containing protein n=1 Tax=Paracoccus sp. Ld10 TaxID=649158 RepID=UPI00386EB1B6
MTRHRMAALMLGTALAPLSALSQPILLDEITLTADGDVPARIAPSTEQIEDARIGTIEDVFRAEPSVTVSSGIAISERVFVNGIDEQQLSVTVDGAAQNNRMFHHTGTNMIDPGLLKAARVDPGVAPADAGFAALGGSIAYETKSAIDMLEDGQTRGGRVTVGYGDNDGTATGSVTLYGRQGPVDALIYAKRATGDAYEDGNGLTVPRTGADLSSQALKLGAEFGDWRAELGAIRFEDDALRPYRANFTGTVGGRPVPETRRYTLEQSTQTLTLRRTVADGLLDPEIRIARSRNQLDTIDLPTADAPDPDYNNGDADTVSIVVQNSMTVNGVELTAGVDNYRTRATYDGVYDGEASSYREDRTTTGLFVQARGTAGDIDYSAGLRHDFSRFTGAGGQQLDTDGTSANADVTWHATDALALNAGLSTVFGGTQLASVYEFSDGLLPDDAYDALDATRAHNGVMGVEWRQGATTLGAELFQTRIDAIRKGLVSRDLESRGFRLSARRDWQGGFAALRYSDTDVELDGQAASSFDLRELGTVPGGMLSLEARHQVMAGVTLGGVIQHAFEEDGQGDDVDSDWPSYTVVDVFAEYEPAAFRNVTLRAEVNNLFDRAYADRATYGADFTSVVQQLEPGRTVAVTADLRF